MKKSFAFTAFVFIVFTCLGILFYLRSISAPPTEEENYLPPIADRLVEPLEVRYPYSIPPRSTLYNVLRELNVSPVTIQNIVDTARPLYNLSRIQPGTRFSLSFSEDGTSLQSIRFRFSPTHKIEVLHTDDQWVANKIPVTIDVQNVSFQGLVTSSLWASAEASQMDPTLIAELAEIFAWQVDFAREVRPRDRWRLTVEQQLVQGQPIGWGAILAAEYENSGQTYSAILFEAEDVRGYFAPDGSSLRRMFLKSPIPYARISSRFQKQRFHPILKVSRPHLGVDYAAPQGTPVRAVGDGLVTFANRRGDAGNMIQLRHNSTYSTAYKHLSGFARGVRSGTKVSQGQVIGYVGSTGLSTAPHLHFEFFVNGRYVDPLGYKFPSADPIPPEHVIAFQETVQTITPLLPEWATEPHDSSSVAATASSPDSADAL